MRELVDKIIELRRLQKKLKHGARLLKQEKKLEKEATKYFGEPVYIMWMKKTGEPK